MLAAVLVSNLISNRLSKISTPLVQIMLGIAIAVIPIFDFDMTLDPELFLALFITPLLFDDAKKADKPALWAQKKSILLLALGLVVVTCLSVGGLITWLIPVIPLAAAIALAAALAPTDAVAVASLEDTSSIKVEKRTLLQGEALFNDASSIVCFQFALAALAVGPLASAATSNQIRFFGEVVPTFLFMFIGGIIVGLVFMLLRFALVRGLRSTGVDSITFHVLFEVVTPFLVFLVAEALHVSGIIAVVMAGIVHSFSPTKKKPSIARHNIVSGSVWGVLSFTLNGLVFLILGTQLPGVVEEVWLYSDVDHLLLIVSIVIILLAIMAIRFVWIFVMHRNNPLTFERGEKRKKHKNPAREKLLAAELRAAEAAAEAAANPITPEQDGRQSERIEALQSKEDRATLLLIEEGATYQEIVEEQAEDKTVTIEEVVKLRKVNALQKRHKFRAERKQHVRQVKEAEHQSPYYFRAHLRDALVLTLTGVKGAISLALLLTVPLVLSTGELFPRRDLLLFLASGAIMLSLLIANFVVPLIAPKTSEPPAPDSEIRARVSILQAVINTLREQMTPQNKRATEAVMRQYRERISAVLQSNQINDPVLDDLRCTAIEWERERTLELIDQGQVGAMIGSVRLYQLSRIFASVKHRSKSGWLISNIGKFFMRRFKHIKMRRKYRKYSSHNTKNPFARRHAIPIVHELQHDNCRYALKKLESLKEQPGIPLYALRVLKAEYEERLNRIENRGFMRAVGSKQQRREFDNAVFEISARALQYERDHIEEAQGKGLISRKAARTFRDNVSMMELDIEAQLD